MLTFISNTAVDFVMVMVVFTLGYWKGYKQRPIETSNCLCDHKINSHYQRGTKKGECSVVIEAGKYCACKKYIPKPISLEDIK